MTAPRAGRRVIFTSIGQFAAFLTSCGGVWAQSALSVDTDWRVSTEFDRPGLSQTQATITPSYESQLSPAVDFALSARLRVDAEDELDPGRPNSDGYFAPNRPLQLDDYGVVELRDAYLSISGASAFLTVGKQQIVWGELEGFKLLDVVNPQSFREFILEEFDQSRIGLWSVNAEYILPESRFGSWTAQFVWTPDPTVHEIPEAGAAFEFLAPRFRFGEPAERAHSIPVLTERRTDVLAASGIGARFVGLVGGWDLALQAYSGVDPEPLGRIETTATGPAIVRFHKRRTIAGVSAARAFGGITLRTEIGVQPARYFTTRNALGEFGQTRTAQFGAAFVADFFAPGDVFVSAQIYYDRVFKADTDLVRPIDDFLTSLYFRRSFLADRAEATLRWYASEYGRDGVIRPKLRYEFSDNAAIELGADFFYGSPDGIFGQFDTRDRVTLAFKRSF